MMDGRAPRASWLNHALRYAALGLHTFPLHAMANGRCTCMDPDCRSPGKHPLTEHGVKDASTDPAALQAWAERWPVSNLGMAMRDSLVCVDIDPRNGGDVQLEALIAEHGALPPTVMALTGGGGEHYLFRNTENRRLPGQLRKGIDIKGEGGYVVVEPSIHASGTAYAWEASSDPLEGVEFAALPAWIGAAGDGGTMTCADVLARPAAVGSIQPRQFIELRAALCYLDHDSRDVWRSVGMALHSTGAPNAYGLWTEWSMQSEKYNPADQVRVWRSFQRSGLHVESIFAWAAAAGWVNPASAAAARFSEAEADAIAAANSQARVELVEPTPEPAVDAFPVPCLNDLAAWIDNRYAITHPDVTRQTALAIAALVASRVYTGLGGVGAHLCLGVVAESAALTFYARDAVARCLTDAGMRRMFRGTRADAANKVYQTLWRSPAAIHVVNDFGHQAQFAKRQPSGALDYAFSVMAEAYSASAIYLDSPLDIGLKSATDDQLVVHAPALTTLLLSTHEQMGALLHRSEMMRGLLAHQLPVIVDTAGAVERAPSNDALPIELRDRMRAVRRLHNGPGDLSQDEIFSAQPGQRPNLVRVRYAVPFDEHAAAIDAISTERSHRPIILVAHDTAQRIANVLGAWHDPQMPEATRDILDWSAGYVIRCIRAWLERYETFGNDDGKVDIAQKVVAVVADRKTNGMPRGELHNYCVAYRRLDKEKRTKLVDGLIEDGDLAENTPPGKRKKVLYAARFARLVGKRDQP